MPQSKWLKRAATRYTIYGALFGVAFPLVAVILVYLFNVSITVLLVIIATAPFVLGIVARVAGVRDDRITAFLAQYGKSAVPFYVLYRPNRGPHVFGELLTKGQILNALAESVE